MSESGWELIELMSCLFPDKMYNLRQYLLTHANSSLIVPSLSRFGTHFAASSTSEVLSNYVAVVTSANAG